MVIQTTNLLADAGKTTSFTTLMDRIDNPVDSGITAYLKDKCLREIINEEKLDSQLYDRDRLR